MLKDKLQEFIKKALERISLERGIFEVNKLSYQIDEPISEHGDYALNIAFNLAKVLQISIRDSALIMIDVLKRQPGFNDYFDKIEEDSNFINFWVKKGVLLNYLSEVLNTKQFFNFNQKTVVIDYSSPNIAKPFGIGHFRSTNIGAALYNIYKFLGYKVIGDNHLGDWGTQFGSLIYQIKFKVLANKSIFEQKKILNNLSVLDLEKIYVDFHSDLQANPELGDEARFWFKKLEDGDREARKIWKYCVEISLKDFNAIYKLLGVKFDYYLGESFYENQMKSVIEEAKHKGLAKESQGALVIELKDMPPAMLVKSDGATTYLARDLAAIKYRFLKFKPDLIIYEVGVEQSLHFRQLFETVKLLGWNNKCELVHVAHGLFELETGKLSTRSGKTIHLEDVLEEARKRTIKIVSKSQMPKELAGAKEIDQIAIGALKYNDLSQHFSRNIVFNWDKVLNLEGNSGPYLQYTHARINSVLDKAAKIKRGKFENINLNNEEINILRKIIKFTDVIKEAGGKFSPHLICNYLFELSQSYNGFYNSCPILKAENPAQQALRLKITESTGKIIKICLGLLGIETPKQM